MYANIRRSTRQKQKMTKTKQPHTKLINLRAFSLIAVGLVFAASSLYIPFVRADSFDEKINALNADSGNKKSAQQQLGVQANGIADVISNLQAQINAAQAKINANEAEMARLQGEIKAAEDELARQKDLLGQTIRQMYLEGDISTVEMLATSKDLSDFFDKQQYRESVRSKVKNTLDKITQLKLELNSQKETVQKLIAEQKALQGQLASQRSENNRLLSLNQAQQGALNSEIKANSAKVSELRRQQAVENARHGSGLVAGSSAKGGYPAKWANAPQDSLIDSWGMYNRECVSYTAWKVHQSGRHMPYWGGRGNANQWPNNTSNKSKIPQVGDVAIAYWGYYGHAMYVERVSGGKVYVSQYNYGVRGEYSEMWVNISEIGWFLHF